MIYRITDGSKQQLFINFRTWFGFYCLPSSIVYIAKSTDMVCGFLFNAYHTGTGQSGMFLMLLLNKKNINLKFKKFNINHL